MTFWEIRNKETGELRSTKLDFGNCMELKMVLDEMNPGVFEVVRVDEAEGA